MEVGYVERQAYGIEVSNDCGITERTQPHPDGGRLTGHHCVTEYLGNEYLSGAFRLVVIGDFDAVRLPLDVADFHTYAVDWTADKADFFVDGVPVRSCPRPPAYPMQLEVAVFDFPEKSDGTDADAVPAFIVDRVREYQR
jgi:hypothetical protein